MNSSKIRGRNFHNHACSNIFILALIYLSDKTTKNPTMKMHKLKALFLIFKANDIVIRNAWTQKLINIRIPVFMDRVQPWS